MPPRGVKAPTTFIRRGLQAATRSSRIWLVACGFPRNLDEIALTRVRARASIRRISAIFRDGPPARAVLVCGHRSARDDIQVRGMHMVEARRMGKSELFSHFAERFEVKRTV